MNRKTFVKTLGLGAVGMLFGRTICKAAGRGSAQTVISCIGDSITWGYTGDDSPCGPDISWTSHLQDLLEVREVHNFGVVSSRFATAADRQDSFVERLPEILKTPADLFLVLGGVNDFLHGIPLGQAGDKDIATVYGAVDHVISEILGRYPESRLVFMTPMKSKYRHPTLTYPSSLEKNRQGLVQADYVEAIRRTCEMYSVPVIDMYARSNISPFIPAQERTYMPDGLHYNAAGYLRLAKRISGELEKYL